MRSSQFSCFIYYVRDVEIETVINHSEAAQPDLPRPSLSGMSFTSSREGWDIFEIVRKHIRYVRPKLYSPFHLKLCCSVKMIKETGVQLDPLVY